MNISIQTISKLRKKGEYKSAAYLNNALLNICPNLNAKYEISNDGMDWVIFIHSSMMDEGMEAFSKLDIKVILNKTPFHIRNLPYWFTKNEVKSNVNESLENVSAIKVFDRLENQPSYALHRGSAKIEIDTKFLLTSDCYEDALEDCKDGGDHIFYFPLMRRPIYLRFWSDVKAESKRSSRRQKNKGTINAQQNRSFPLKSDARKTYNWNAKGDDKIMVDNSQQNKSVEKNQIQSSNKEKNPKIKPHKYEIANNYNASEFTDNKSKSCETNLANLSTDCKKPNLTQMLLQDTLNQNKILMKHLLLNQKLIIELVKRNPLAVNDINMKELEKSLCICDPTSILNFQLDDSKPTDLVSSCILDKQEVQGENTNLKEKSDVQAGELERVESKENIANESKTLRECNFNPFSGISTPEFDKAASTSLPSSPLNDKNDTNLYSHLVHLDLEMNSKIKSPFKSRETFHQKCQPVHSPPTLSNPTNKKLKRSHGKDDKANQA